MDAFGVPQVSPGATGIHLSWCGPSTWVYAPGGWIVQRRPAKPAAPRECERLDRAAIVELRTLRERRLSFGLLTLRDGRWLHSADGTSTADSDMATEVFRVELDETRRATRVQVSAKLSFVVVLLAGRAVGASGPSAGPANHLLRAPRFDTILVYALAPDGLQVCVDVVGDSAAEWEDIPALVKGLTLPFRELMPSLATDADELAEARSRLLPGEDVDEEAFARVATTVRPLIRAAGPPRPSELVVLLREEQADDADEARALDPIRVMLVHPTLRRALGFGIFDDDPTLVPGQSYEYRVSAAFSAQDVHDANHGFSTVPSGTLLPAVFGLGGPRVRVPTPVPVALAPGTPLFGPVHITRRGIRLDPRRESFWLGPSLDDWSLVVDFEAPVDSVVLELAAGHDLEFSAGAAAGPFAQTFPVPSGTSVRLDLGGPVEQVRLRGTGFLHAFRVPTVADGSSTFSVVLPPITLADTPLPSAPLTATAENLQQPVPPATALVPPDAAPSRPALGFSITWVPAPAFGLTAWPADLDAALPLDATVFELQHREEPSADWLPVLSEDRGWVLGDRGSVDRALTLEPGVDLMDVFPADAVRTTGADLELSFTDAFASLDEPGEVPVPGSFHRYRVRAIDAIGRPSAAWRETGQVRLEKHVPPPVPVGPERSTTVDAPAGVQCRVLVRDAPDLTDAERALLAGSETAVALRWGWHAEQREQDPFATEFRVYAAPPMDVVTGTVTTVTLLSSGRVTSYRLDLLLDTEVQADVAAGLRLDAGHPFFIRSNTAGDAVQMVVETRLRFGGTAMVPNVGRIRLFLPLTPDRSRPPAWTVREVVLPITGATTYETVLGDRLHVSGDAPVDSLWVGVSTADNQAYVEDQLVPADNRPGNESAIVPVHAVARYHGRPTLEIPPPLAGVPVLLTPEPGAEPVHFPLDLTTYLPSRRWPPVASAPNGPRP